MEPSDVGNYTCVVAIPGAKQSVQGPPTPLVLRGDGKYSPLFIPNWTEYDVFAVIF